jgi:hypothetical protein
MEDICSFVNIQKYQNNTEFSQLENYTTELFVFLLNYLKRKKSPILKEILYEFEFRNEIDYEDLEIHTQYRFSYENGAIVDISIFDILIKHKEIKTIIEVKVDSALNKYERDGKTLNQIEYYERIPDVQNVYLLSKRIVKIEKPENRILWSKIHGIINASNDFVVENFAKYLEANGMDSITKLNKDDLTALISISSFHALSKLLLEAWPYDYDESYSLTPLNISIKNGYLGCYIKKGDEKLIWVGIGGQKDGILLSEILNEDIRKGLKEKGEDEWALGSLDLNDIVNRGTFEDQKVAVNEWYWAILKELEKI